MIKSLIGIFAQRLLVNDLISTTERSMSVVDFT